MAATQLEPENAGALPNGLDSRIGFIEQSHTYFYREDGQECAVPQSVTSALSTIFRTEMNAHETASAGIDRWRRDPKAPQHQLVSYLIEYKGMTKEQAVQELVAMWAHGGEEARRKGTQMHATLEDYIKKRYRPPDPSNGPAMPPYSIVGYLAFLEQYYPHLQMRPWASELRLARNVHPNPAQSRAFAPF